MDIRCIGCNKKLLEAKGDGEVIITCPRCKKLYMYLFNTKEEK